MKTVNRAALLVRPKESFIKWAASVEAGAHQDAQELRGYTAVYLVREDPRGREESAPLKNYYRAIFDQELGSWYTDEATWPKTRDLKTFKEWFDVQAESIVVDLAGQELPLKTEDM